MRVGGVGAIGVEPVGVGGLNFLVSDKSRGSNTERISWSNSIYKKIRSIGRSS